jgi:23S rRNA (cytidine1920-2'-O)/16S rRNA (cytidine1409-2'-O)-methyltransferase
MRDLAALVSSRMGKNGNLVMVRVPVQPPLIRPGHSPLPATGVASQRPMAEPPSPASGRRNTSQQRADLALLARGFFESRAKAQEAIAAGLVQADGRTLRKASELIGAATHIEARAPYPWVSRGGVKLEAALEAFGFDPAHRICLDIGASTGGFTHVLLARGAAEVHAIDVGHGQLHESLRCDARVLARESTDARDLTPQSFRQAPQFITCDVSFISLALVLPPVLALASPDAVLVALIKPQFEVGPSATVKGIVKDAQAHTQVCARITALVDHLGWKVMGLIPSPIEGADGNREFLLGARRG